MSEASHFGRSAPPAASDVPPDFRAISPPVSLPMRHFGLAAAAFPLFAAGLAWGAPRLVGFGFEPRFALGLVHILTLGWVAQTILGAWTQMIPTHGGTPLVSLPAAKAAWWLFVSGAAAFVAVLWSGSDRYWVPAALLYSGLLLSLAVLGATHARAARRSWTGVHFTASFLWLAVLGLVGTLMAVDRHRAVVFRDPEGGLIAHVHMALVGFLSTAVFGAGYRLFPDIALYQLRSRLEGRAAFALLQAGLAGLALDCLFFGRRLMPLWAELLCAAYLAYFSQARAALKKGLPAEPGSAMAALMVLGGGLWAALGLSLAFGWLLDEPAARAAYVYAALVGFATPAILSQIHRIAPFLAWLHAHRDRRPSGPSDPPTLEDLTSRPLAWAEFVFLAAALPLGVAGFLRESELLVRAAGAALLACAACNAVNAAFLIRARQPRGPHP